MGSVNVAEAKDKLTSLLNAAQGGETVTITRHGKPVAELRPVAPVKRGASAASIDWITTQLADIPTGNEDGAKTIRALRDSDDIAG
jgi:prevent-host-death family protein